MKKEKKKVDLSLQQVDCERRNPVFGDMRFDYTYTFVGHEGLNPEAFEIFTEIEVPETLVEFREMHGLSKDELVDWLNKNYKQ